jgi:DNA-binding NarL/FixJ family response regulator
LRGWIANPQLASKKMLDAAGSKSATHAAGLESLTRREREVLELAAHGQTNSAIGGQLGLSVHAVKFHLASVYRKLGVTNRTEAAAAFLTAAMIPVYSSEGEGT